jgi:membrane protein required for colicin V production
MNWLDIVIAIILVIGLVVGLMAGLIRMVVSIAGLFLGIFLAGHYYHALAGKLTFISSDRAASVVAYVVILIGVMVVAAIVAWLLNKLASAIMLGWLNHLVGAVLGLVMAGMFIGAILAIWAKYGGGGNTISSSFLGGFLLDKFPVVLALLPGEFDTIHSFFK